MCQLVPNEAYKDTDTTYAARQVMHVLMNKYRKTNVKGQMFIGMTNDIIYLYPALRLSDNEPGSRFRYVNVSNICHCVLSVVSHLLLYLICCLWFFVFSHLLSLSNQLSLTCHLVSCLFQVFVSYLSLSCICCFLCLCVLYLLSVIYCLILLFLIWCYLIQICCLLYVVSYLLLSLPFPYLSMT